MRQSQEVTPLTPEERAEVAERLKAKWGPKPHKPRVQTKKGLKVWEVMVALPVGYLTFLGMSALVARFVK